MKKFFFGFTLILATGISIFEGCKKEDNTEQLSNINISMKDAPAAYDAVYIDVRGIEINTEQHGWISSPVTDSIYNLLSLQGINAAYLTLAVLPAGNISQVRLLLGSNNSVVIAGATFPLLLSSQDETGLKINVSKNLSANVTYDLLLDFKAEESIVVEGNGSYRLKPVLSGIFLQ